MRFAKNGIRDRRIPIMQDGIIVREVVIASNLRLQQKTFSKRALNQFDPYFLTSLRGSFFSGFWFSKPNGMQFFILAAILCAVFASSGPSNASSSFSSVENIWLTIGLPFCLPGLVSALLCARIQSVKPQNTAVLNDLGFVEKFGIVIWFVVTVSICFGTSWAGFTDRMSSSTTIATCVFLSPILLSLISVWLILSIACRATPTLPSLIRGVQQVWLQIKLQLLTILIPLGILMVANDVAKSDWFSSQVFGPESSNAMNDLKYFLLPAAMLLVVCLMPKILCWILPTRTISQTQLGRQLLVLAKESGVWLDDVKLWNTGNRVMNGLVVGLQPIGRQILLTDRLIHLMDANQIAAVFLHEIGHAKRNHMLIRFAVVSVPMAGNYFLLTSNGFSEVLAILFSILVTGFIFGWVAKVLEFDADQFASRQLTRFCGSNQSYIQSLEIIRADQPKSDRFSWLHPTVSNRIKRLKAMTPAPALNPSKH